MMTMLSISLASIHVIYYTALAERNIRDRSLERPAHNFASAWNRRGWLFGYRQAKDYSTFLNNVKKALQPARK